MNRTVQPPMSLACVLLACAGTLLSCSDCKFERKRVEAFLADDANFKCETDADCDTAAVGCLDIDGEFCGQIGMSKRASTSREWQEVRTDLADCLAIDTCTTCNAALLPRCNNGSCR